MIREAGGLCIADEVQTGFGRTGSAYWGFQNQVGGVCGWVGGRVGGAYIGLPVVREQWGGLPAGLPAHQPSPRFSICLV